MQNPFVSARGLPFIGNTFYNLGRMYQLAMTPCDADPLIMVYAAFQYTPMLIWSIVKPDPVDYLTTRFGQVHKRKRKRRLISNIIDINPSNSGRGLRWASWKGIGLEQRIGWYFLIADATSDFLVNWTSMVHTFSGCQTPGAPFASTARSTPYVQIFGNNTVNTIGGTAGPQHIWISGGPGLICQTTGPKSVGGGISVGPNGSEPMAPLFRVWIEKDGPTADGGTDLQPSPPDPSHTIQYGGVAQHRSTFDTGGTFRIWMSGGAGSVIINSWFLSAQGTLDEGFEPDP